MELDRRKQVLLQAIVHSYVKSAEPIGSEWLATNQKLGVRSATIRNELSEMTEMGYLRQPHTSAGRVPSDLGYRYYVDRLMTWARLSQGESRALREAGGLSDVDVELLLTQTCRVLSSLTRYTSIAAPPVSDAPIIRQVHAAQIGSTQLLLVMVLEGGQIIHRFVEMPRALKPAEVTQISGALEQILAGKPATSLSTESLIPEDARFLEPLLRPLMAALERALSAEEADLYLEGASHIFGQPEFREVQKVEPLIRLLEERKTAFENLRSLLSGAPVSVVIGAENSRSELRECSVVAARYEAGQRSYGWIGVIGPTRMSYERAMPVVRFAARSLSQIFQRLLSE